MKLVRTDIMQKYIDALIRDGADFDPITWHKTLRQESAKGSAEKSTSSSSPVHLASLQPIRPAEASPQQTVTRDKKRPVEQQLTAVIEAWDDFQTSRRRDAVYDFLSAVFQLVRHHYARRRKKRLLRELRKMTGNGSSSTTDLFTRVIRAAAAGDSIDRKTISKWSRALRYVDKMKPIGISVREFMRGQGGVNGCAERYSAYFRASPTA